jgi:hypothetical protein
MRAFGAVATALVLLGGALSGCTAQANGEHPGEASRKGAIQTVAATARCRGVSYDGVRGTEPDLMRPPLRKYAATPAVCAAYWIPQVDDAFIPQALALGTSSTGTTSTGAVSKVFVGGYHWYPTYGNRPCQIAILNPSTGAVTAFAKRFTTTINGTSTFCRHGGGLELDEHGLWLLETRRLWLLDPDALTTSRAVKRVWSLPTGVRGSTLVIAGNRLGIGSYKEDRRGRLWWFDKSRVVQAGRQTLPAPTSSRLAPVKLQGLGDGPGGIWTNASSTHCAELREPGRAARDFVPGSEDLEFRGQDIWTVSESATRAYLDAHELVVPQVLRVDLSQTRALPRVNCGF